MLGRLCLEAVVNALALPLVHVEHLPVVVPEALPGCTVPSPSSILANRIVTGIIVHLALPGHTAAKLAREPRALPILETAGSRGLNDA